MYDLGAVSHSRCRDYPGIVNLCQSLVQKNPRGAFAAAGILVLLSKSENQMLDKATETNETDAQHQQGHDGHAVLAQGRNAFKEDRVGDRAGS